MRFQKMDLNYRNFFIFFLLFCCVQISYASQFEPFEHINEVAKNFIVKNVTLAPDEKIEVKLNQITSALRLPVCTKPIEADFPHNANREQITTIELTCQGQAAWHTYIPVTVQIFTQVVVAKQSILPKENITIADLDYSLHDKNSLFNGYYTDKNDVLGQVAAHLITPGTVLNKKNIQQPVLAHRNQKITIIARRNAVVISMEGIAKSDGSLNSPIQVYNPSSKRTLDAIVIGPNKAEVVS